jgi:RNA polymerase sigma-70 factor (ECF subfamily)
VRHDIRVTVPTSGDVEEPVNAVSTSLEARPQVAETRPRSFAEVAEAELEPVYRYLVFLTGDRSLAEDLTGETFERALRSWRRFDPRRGAARTWLCQIARSTALDHFRADRRRRRREEVYARDNEPALETVFSESLSGPLEHALRELSAGEREVVALRVLLDLDGPAAARVLGISHTACSTRLSRALRRLEEKIGHVCD